jgi:hypothetical protein
LDLVDEAALAKSLMMHESLMLSQDSIEANTRFNDLMVHHRQRDVKVLKEFSSVERKYLKHQNNPLLKSLASTKANSPQKKALKFPIRPTLEYHRANGILSFERKEVSRKTKSKVVVKETYIKSEQVLEFILAEEEEKEIVLQ